jgi:hypothetical protein
MILSIIAILLIAFLFFGLIPGIGAFLIRAQWHRFRQKLINASLLSIADFSLLESGTADKSLGNFRFFGTIESIQGKNRLWISNNTFSVGIEMEKTSLYFLRSYPVDVRKSNVEFLDETIPDEEPDYLPWEKIYSLPSGIQIFISGQVFIETGQLVFRQKEKDSLLIIIFDGERETLLKRCIWSARQKNEYYNQFTIVSLILGSLLLLLISFLLVSNPHFSVLAFLALTLSTFPIIYLFPPGVLLYFLYRSFWKRSRLLRAERDLLLLPLRYFPPETDYRRELVAITLANGEKYVSSQWKPGEKNTPFTLSPEMKIRGSSLFKQPSEESVNYVFGVQTGHGTEKSNDPMVELLCIPGNPKLLAAECDKKSKELGIVSAFCIFSGLILNFVLIFLLLLTALKIGF